MIDVKVTWINLDHALSRNFKTKYALESGKWFNNSRFSAINGTSSKNYFLPYCSGISKSASLLPGVSRFSENNLLRLTNRCELACAISWQLAITSRLKDHDFCDDSWYLFIEDDVASSFAVPNAWPFRIEQLIEAANQIKDCLIIQMCPINGRTRRYLHTCWSKQKQLLIKKKNIRSHGNGVILLKGKALRNISRKTPQLFKIFDRNLYLLPHPFNVRPVADKLLYSYIPIDSIYVLTYPLFCLDADDSFIHANHTSKYHKSSQKVTLDIWKQDKQTQLLDSYYYLKKLSG